MDKEELYDKFEEMVDGKSSTFGRPYRRSDEALRELLCQFDKDDFREMPVMTELLINKRITLLQELHDKGMPFDHENQEQLLHIACGWGGDLECVRFLVESNISTDIHKRLIDSEYGNLTPLTLAMSYRYRSIVKYFREKFKVESIDLGDIEEILNRARSNFREEAGTMILYGNVLREK